MIKFSSELNDKLNNLWIADSVKNQFISKLNTSLKKKLTSDSNPKTKAEVEAIAKNKFNELNESTLKEYFINALNVDSSKASNEGKTSVGFIKEMNVKTAHKGNFDIQNFKFNKTKSTISFDLVRSFFGLNSISVDNRSAEYSLAESTIFRFSNLKIESFVREVVVNSNKNGNKTKLIPSIIFSPTQLPDTKLQLIKYEFQGGNIDELRKYAEILYDYSTFDNVNEPVLKNKNPSKPSKEDFINNFLYGEGSILVQKQIWESVKKLDDKLGQNENGIFTIKSEIMESIDCDSQVFGNEFNIFPSFGFMLDYGQNNTTITASTTPLVIGTPIMYSTISNNEVDWEIYSLLS